VKAIRISFAIAYGATIALFFSCGAALIGFAAIQLWNGVTPVTTVALQPRFTAVLEAIGLITVAVAALELGQTVLEEEVLRQAHMSAPTRARRFLSRFLIVVVVALSVETLVAVFKFVQAEPSRLPDAAWIGISAAALLAAWGVFVRLNRSAEELEPEAMEHAKREDRHVQ
jgi:hypothetical protein